MCLILSRSYSKDLWYISPVTRNFGFEDGILSYTLRERNFLGLGGFSWKAFRFMYVTVMASSPLIWPAIATLKISLAVIP